MNTNAVAQMNNVMGRLMQLEALGLAGAQGGDLFCAQGPVSLKIPELGLDVQGREAVLAALADVSHPYRGRGCFHLLHSAGYQADDDHAKGHWNTYSFCFLDPDEKGLFHSVRFGYLRFTVDFRPEGGSWRVSHLDARSLVWVDPWTYDPAHEPGLLDAPGTEAAFPLSPTFPAADGETYVALRNLIGLFVHNGPIKAKSLFAKNADLLLDIPTVLDAPAHGADAVMAALDAWEAKERENWLYLTVQMATDPVITVSDPDHARVSSLALCLDTLGRAFGHKENPYPVLPRLAFLDFTCVREEGAWRLTQVTQKAVANLGPWSQTITSGGRCVMLEEINRVYAPETCASGKAEDVFEAESILPQWTERLKRHDLPDFVPMYMGNSQRELSIILSRSFFGRPDVLKHCDTLINAQLAQHPTMRKYPQFHNGNTPVAQISEDGNFALIAWFDFCWGNIGAGVFYDAEDTRRQYFPGVGKYYHSFVKENGQWKLYRFGWYPLSPWFKPWDYTVGQAGGWSAMDTDAPWPLPFEEAQW